MTCWHAVPGILRTSQPGIRDCAALLVEGEGYPAPNRPLGMGGPGLLCKEPEIPPVLLEGLTLLTLTTVPFPLRKIARGSEPRAMK
jgi:hypothetical protein